MPSPAAANGYTTASHTGTNGTAPPTTALQPRKLEPKTDSTASVPDFKTSEDYPQKVIMEVGMHVTWRVDGIKIVHKNDAETAKRGTSTKGEKVFLLDEGEYITHVWYAADAGSVQGILFGTSNGRKSVWFGYEYGLYGLLIKDSHVLTDLRGASQDSQLNDLVPSWVRYIPGGGITAFLALYDELVARWNEFQSSIAELKKQTVSSKASLDELTTYEQTIARGLAELVQDVEILRGMENEQSTAQVVVTSLREKYISNHLGACKEAARAAQTQFNNLALALAPISGQVRYHYAGFTSPMT
ncbi:uncharacterized protein PHACADRAFT_103493 [Phanerochaete carnosa HHB-10118-sp]|uniref:Jacalin-type lectin domain-containing protein n=1 Tax=Phanerochaete carnosa (strain HHB-10118-sp) TaxID=650164 RepID=K5VHZ1_PHACS|nr:uncharacterized protein PHACADRAFT_103493 [Phanerochaete carnosa HHB-10118-sp]EKM50868.1 hypothetical protein PHACADRAFT_103493 [Phanerochaete carnosa HHB-10118-sp]